MAYSKITDDMNIIQALPDEPNDVGGLTAAQLKAKFDEAGNKIKTAFNNLVDELNGDENGVSASAVSFTSSAGVPATNVQDAVENVQSQLAGISQGAVADGSITTLKLDDLSVTTAKINDLAVTTGKLANDAVTTDKILDGSVTPEKLSSDARSPISVSWDDVTNNVSLTYLNYPVREASKIFKFSEALGLMFFSITCNITPQVGAGRVVITQAGYPGSFSSVISAPVSAIGYSAKITLRGSDSATGSYVNSYDIYVGNGATADTITISGFYFCDGSGEGS